MLDADNCVCARDGAWLPAQATKHVWLQEEGSGHGAWSWMDAHFSQLKANGKPVQVRIPLSCLSCAHARPEWA